jgi:hypothetical protein
MNFILDATTKSIVAVMSGSAATTNPDFTAAYADSTGALFTEGANDGAFNGTSQVTLVSAPAASTRRVIKSLTIKNRDTAAVTITISYNNNSTLRTIAKVTLAVGDTWTTDGTFDTNGNLKQSLGTISLTSQVTGTLPVGNGGTGATTLTGVLKGNGTSAFTAATAGTDYVAPGTATTFTADQTFNSTRLKLAGSTSGTATIVPQAAAGTVTMTLPTDTSTLGYINAPINSQSAAYTAVLSDAGKVILHPSTDANARTFTIPANSSVAYPDGTVLTFVNMTSQVVTIAITSDTLYLAGTGTTGSRSLAQYGMATAVKLTSTTWLINGSGLT